ncbi:hypothetical protein AK88_05611 [Plasmodium fragile]|uniref:Uncharacterized protein n=1 Tax=Plasmodium fragile TaxID=5857 RepID=A0A0D9QCM4_PLAFR|nr:uncharacterized protein AK88_05611 [Plasmodium fragile]KJP84758.1 hypothetical protein AK88_05611 [Plasmodium fragile]
METRARYTVFDDLTSSSSQNTLMHDKSEKCDSMFELTKPQYTKNKDQNKNMRTRLVRCLRKLARFRMKRDTWIAFALIMLVGCIFILGSAGASMATSKYLVDSAIADHKVDCTPCNFSSLFGCDTVNYIWHRRQSRSSSSYCGNCDIHSIYVCLHHMENEPPAETEEIY